MNLIQLVFLAAAITVPAAASAKVLEVGPDKQYKKPSEAIAAAGNGDDVRIAGGQYFDCAIVKQDGVTIEMCIRDRSQAARQPAFISRWIS